MILKQETLRLFSNCWSWGIFLLHKSNLRLHLGWNLQPEIISVIAGGCPSIENKDVVFLLGKEFNNAIVYGSSKVPVPPDNLTLAFKYTDGLT